MKLIKTKSRIDSMTKYFRLRIPKYLTSHSKPERLAKYFAKEERLNRMKFKEIEMRNEKL